MNFKIDRIISIATLVTALIAIILVLRRPAPVVAPAGPAPVALQSQTSDPSAASSVQREASTPFSGPATIVNPGATNSVTGSQMAQSTSAQPQGSGKPAEGMNSDQVSAAVAKMLGGGGAGLANLSPDSNVGGGDPVIKDQQVSMDGDVIHGKFLTTIAGKDVWVTISGHMGEKDGYATFDPTEFKVGDMEVPVSLVNPALQRKLAEQRDRLKIPNGQ